MKALLKKLDQIIELLLSDREERKVEKEEKQRAENERLLVEYAKGHNKRLPAGAIQNGRDAMDVPVKSDGDLIPFGLSERDRAILNEFYNGPK